MADIKASVIGLYFSAHWCGPCRGFTPKLVRKYNQLREAGSELEIVFISSDRSASDAELYYEEMPWCTLDYEDREMKNMLSRVYDVSGIPSLVLLNGDGELITDEGRTVLMDTPFEKIPSYRS